jgi:hypothetical protein
MDRKSDLDTTAATLRAESVLKTLEPYSVLLLVLIRQMDSPSPQHFLHSIFVFFHF